MSLCAVAAAPVHAATLGGDCTMSQHDAEILAQMGYPDNANQVMHVSVDLGSQQVTVWETSPEFPEVKADTYRANITDSTVSWVIPNLPDDDDNEPNATGSLDRASNVLTTVDPDGGATEWDCH